MANFVYTEAKRALLAGELDMNAHDIRVMLVMTNTTADTEEDKTTISGFTTLDEMDGAGYARQALANEAVAADNPNNRGEFDADNVNIANVSAGTRQVAGVVVFRHVTNDADSVPICYIDDDCPFDANGGDIDITWNAEGILQLT
jgi:hypothetical protein